MCVYVMAILPDYRGAYLQAQAALAWHQRSSWPTHARPHCSLSPRRAAFHAAQARSHLHLPAARLLLAYQRVPAAGGREQCQAWTSPLASGPFQRGEFPVPVSAEKAKTSSRSGAGCRRTSSDAVPVVTGQRPGGLPQMGRPWLIRAVIEDVCRSRWGAENECGCDTTACFLVPFPFFPLFQ